MKNKVIPKAHPQIEEYIEAAQEDADKRRKKAVEKFSESDQQKILAIEQAVKILVDNKVLFYLIPYLPHPNHEGKEYCWQWNSLAKVLGFDEVGNLSSQSKETIHNFFTSLIHYIDADLFGDCQTLEEFNNKYFGACKYTRERLNNDLPKDEDNV